MAGIHLLSMQNAIQRVADDPVLRRNDPAPRGASLLLCLTGSLEPDGGTDLTAFQDGQFLLGSCQLRSNRPPAYALLKSPSSSTPRRPRQRHPPVVPRRRVSAPRNLASQFLVLAEPGPRPYNPARHELFDLCACSLVDMRGPLLPSP